MEQTIIGDEDAMYMACFIAILFVTMFALAYWSSRRKK